MKACIILHNMIVEEERESFTQYDILEFQQGEGVDLTYSFYIFLRYGYKSQQYN